ncbi:MAG: hypothetical protein AMXMBFR51_29980 [Ignavibacteriota bacterium]
MKIHKDIILDELNRRMLEVLRAHGAPLRVSVLLEKIPFVKVDPSRDPYQNPFDEISEYEGDAHSLATVQIFENHIDELIQKDKGFIYFRSFFLIGLTSFYQKELYLHLCDFLNRKEDKKNTIQKIAEFLAARAVTGHTNLPSAKNYDWIREIILLARQYPKTFRLESATGELILLQKADLQKSIIETICTYGDFYSDSDYGRQVGVYPIVDLLQKLNNSENYFKIFQEEVNFEDVFVLRNKNKKWFAVERRKNEEILILHLLNMIDHILNKNFNNSLEIPHKGRRIYAYKYKGDHFPFQEAVDYLKIRPLIYIKEVTWESREEHPDMLSPNPDDELWRYLKALVPVKTSFTDWIKDNIQLSWIDEEEASLSFENLFEILIEEYSPIFNVDNNPGNLFKYTLQEKLVNYEAVKK